MKTSPFGCSKMFRWRNLCVAGIIFAIALLACDIMVRVSHDQKQRGSADGMVVERQRRSADVMSLGDRSTTSAAVEVHNETPIPSGAVFTRWGRSDCPPASALIYKGVMGSGYAGHKGGGAEYLCMTDEPEWMGAFGTITKWSIIYGVEYKENILGIDIHQNAVCAVCQSRRNNKLMIPGRISCPANWSKEYHGYLMSSEYREEAGNNFICVDLLPEADRSGFKAESSSTLYHVYSSCGSLPCPKYKEAGMVTCIVCTR